MENESTVSDEKSPVQSVSFWVLVIVIAGVTVVFWEPTVRRLGAESLSHDSLEMGVFMFAIVLLERVFRKGMSEIGWADLAVSVAGGTLVGVMRAIL